MMKNILYSILLLYSFSSFSQSIDTLMYRAEILDRLDRIEDTLSINNLPLNQVIKPNFVSLGLLKNSNGVVEIDVANTKNEYPGIFTSTIRFNFYDENHSTKENKKYKFIEIGSVIVCDGYDAGIQPTEMKWINKKGESVKTVYGKIKKVDYRELDSQFMSVYKYICRKK
jgi:hypothetical protein